MERLYSDLQLTLPELEATQRSDLLQQTYELSRAAPFNYDVTSEVRLLENASF